MTDTADGLLARVASGDETAFEELAQQYAPLISAMSARFAPSFSGATDTASIGQQDLEQEARLALYRAARTFDRAKNGVTFGLYAKICIRNALISLLRKSATQGKASRRSNAESASEREPLAELVSASETGALRTRIREVLSSYENHIFEQYISGMSVKSISRSVGKPEKSVSNALYRVRVKIKGLLHLDSL